MENRRVKCWIVTKNGERIACHSFNEIAAVSPSRIGRFIMSDSEINNTVRLNRKKLKQLEPVFRKRKVT